MTPSQLADLRRLVEACEALGGATMNATGAEDACASMRAYVDARTPTEEAVAFFHEWAGWSYDPTCETEEQGRQRCAEDLAEAELLAKLQEWEFSWDDDADPWDGDVPAPERLESCQLRHGRDVLASLWGIGDADDNYRRVVQAELALEALGSMV